MPHRARDTAPPASLPGLTRQSIHSNKLCEVDGCAGQAAHGAVLISCPGRSAARHPSDRCAAEPGPSSRSVSLVPVLRSDMKMPRRAGTRHLSVIPDLTRQSIRWNSRRLMDARVKPAHDAIRFRAPDAAQRVALAERCAAEPGPSRTRVFRSSRSRSDMKNTTSPRDTVSAA